MPEPRPSCINAVPILFVRDVSVSAAWYEERLGFATEFLYGSPPFYGAVGRDGVHIHLRHVDQPNFAELAAREPSLILATIEVSDVTSLFGEIEDRGAELAQRLIHQQWGGIDFQVRDPDGNAISFVEFPQMGATTT